MLVRILKGIVAGIAIPTLGLGVYAEITQDSELRLTALSLLAVVLAAAFALGMFRRGRAKAPRSPVAETKRPVAPQPQADAALKADRSAQPPKKETSDEITDEDELYIVFARLAGIKTGEAFKDGVKKVIANNRLEPLSPANVIRLAREIDKRDLRGKSFVRTPGVAIVRLQRADLDVEVAGTSWLGGLPTLSALPWPRDAKGRAMHHLAQIDLGTIPDPLLPKGMPNVGALAFFMTTSGKKLDQGKVIYLPLIANSATEPPEDLSPIYDGPDWGYYVKGHARESAPDTFPRWPLEFVLLPLADKTRDNDAHELMAEMLPLQSDIKLSPNNYRQSLPDFARPVFWDTAHRFTNSIRLARDDIDLTVARTEARIEGYGARYQADLDVLLKNDEAFSQFVDEVSIWAVVHEPWHKMAPEDVAQLHTYFGRVRDIGQAKASFKPFYQFTQGELLSIDEATTATLLAAANGPPDVYAKLPFEVRDDIDTKYRLAGKGRWHQMFGLGTEIKTAVRDHTHHHLLLQLHSDQLVNWMWGDMGVVQFWIAEEDVLEQNWDAVEMTIEAH
jgi:uncharacterized protein YwqG